MELKKIMKDTNPDFNYKILNKLEPNCNAIMTDQTQNDVNYN